MTTNGKVVINLATGLEDPERVTLAFLVGSAAAQAGRHVTLFVSKEAVRIALPGVAQGGAMAVRRWRRSSHSTRRPGGGCSSARSASTRANSVKTT
jgi:hypothetical protein